MLYAIIVFISFFLMLVFMTYNVRGLCELWITLVDDYYRLI